jgi:hypothetical protein
MRKSKIIIIAGLLVTLFSFIGCTKFDEVFNFNNLNGIEGTSSWGVPIINAKYSIGDILQKMDSSQVIRVESDGSLTLFYTFDKEKIIKASDFLTIGGQNYSGSFNLNPNHIPNSISVEQNSAPINFENDMLEIYSATLKSGSLQITVSHDITQDFFCTISTPNIKTSSGANFTLTFSPGELSRTIDLTNYTFIPDANNSATFGIESRITNNGTPPSASHYMLNVSIQISEITFKSLYAKLNSYEIPFDESFDFDISSDQYGGDITVYRPKLTISALNSFLVKGRVDLDTAAFTGENMYASIISSSPVQINLPISPSYYSDQNVNGFASITLNTEYNKLKISGNAVLNPDGFDAGVIRIDENSEISVKLKAEIPVDIKISNIFYMDTIPFNLSEIIEQIPSGDFHFIDTLALRTYFESTLPLNAGAQIYFMDTTTNTITDSLFKSTNILFGSFSGTPVPSPTQMYYITDERLERIKNCGKLIFKVNLNTDNREVVFNIRQYLKASLGLKAVFNYQDITINQ